MLRAGILDRSDRPEPAAHIWTRSRQPWVALPAGVPAGGMPGVEAFAAALDRA